jgi:excinuclease UvrABC nuclease subunit
MVVKMAWQSINLMEERNKLPNSPATYVIYFNNDMVYIGSSKDIRNRFSGHGFRYGYARNIITPWHEIHDSVAITLKYKITKKMGEWSMREIRLIHKLKPLFNSHHKGRAKK